MKKLYYFSFLLAFLALSCKGNVGSVRKNGELLGVKGRPSFGQQDEPYGMVYIPAGSFVMGASEEDISANSTNNAKVTSISSFFMDQHEITNNEYRQFVFWVMDSLYRKALADADVPGFKIPLKDDEGNETDNFILNWDTPIKETIPEQAVALSSMYYPENERFFGKKDVDVRKLEYTYRWIDYRSAAFRGDRKNGYTDVTDRSVYVKENKVHIYPDTLVWISDYTYSFNEPLSNLYFSHPAFDNYPVVGVNWSEAKAFAAWRTKMMNDFLLEKGQPVVQDFRLPTEAEWEWAARGGIALSPYPWGGPYLRNGKGCFLANFKPLRGDYASDGGVYTVPVDSYNKNDYGLYCMAGNVAEYTSNTFDESMYSFSHDLNPNYEYDAQETDGPALRRKVVRGGSWKDVAYYLQNSTRSYEYQDSANSYTGFRCVMSVVGGKGGF